ALVPNNHGDHAARQEIQLIVAKLASERHTPLQLRHQQRSILIRFRIVELRPFDKPVECVIGDHKSRGHECTSLSSPLSRRERGPGGDDPKERGDMGEVTPPPSYYHRLRSHQVKPSGTARQRCAQSPTHPSTPRCPRTD